MEFINQLLDTDLNKDIHLNAAQELCEQCENKLTLDQIYEAFDKIRSILIRNRIFAFKDIKLGPSINNYEIYQNVLSKFVFLYNEIFLKNKNMFYAIILKIYDDSSEDTSEDTILALFLFVEYNSLYTINNNYSSQISSNFLVKKFHVCYYPEKYIFKNLYLNTHIATIKSLLNYYKFEISLINVSETHKKEIEDYINDRYGGLNTKRAKH